MRAHGVALVPGEAVARMPRIQLAHQHGEGRAIVDEPGVLGDGSVIREGFSPDLDQLRTASRDATGYLAGLEQRERERTGIPLKVGYNRVFGYYIEVTTANLHLVPDDYQRRQ